MIGAIVRRKPGKPPLVLIDFINMRATRYWPKPGDQRPATFLTHVGELQKAPNAPWLMGEPAALDLLENFRQGKLSPLTDEDLAEPEVA